ncbi:MAG TPA: CarD family transcriptional regulator, partial [Pseudomonadales bacterium]|nr:CarD family transcriptional regulator [Pseudomonadales bacterium]
DEIETLRTFDPDTQRSIDKIESIELLPAKEFPLDPAAIKRFKENWRDHFDVDYRQCSVYQDVSQGLASAGIEYYLPLFFDRVGDLFEYLPKTALIAVTGSLNTALATFWADCCERYEDRRHDRTRPILPPQKLFLTEEECFRQLKQFPRLNLTSEVLETQAGVANAAALEPPALPVEARSETPYATLQAHVSLCTSHHTRILFCAESAGRRETLQELLNKAGIRPQQKRSWLDFITDPQCEIGITVGPLEQGIWLTEPAICVISEPQLFGQRVMQKRRRRKADLNAENVFKNLNELRIGAPVVHIDHGVGRYLGLQTITIENDTQEFLTLEYADKAKLYVPVASLHLISRYSGVDDENAPLHRLGTDQWQKEKRKAAEQIHDVAAELLSTYARRAAKPGHAFSWDERDYEIFADGFPFEETPDQSAAIEAVIHDLKAAKPMDRLVCGDVGFGKTEVAMRAAFIVV